MPDQASKLSEDCIKVANEALGGTMTLTEFKCRWPLDADKDRLLWRLMNEVQHFLVDQDIRSKDIAYQEYQRKVITELIADVAAKYTGQTDL